MEIPSKGVALNAISLIVIIVLVTFFALILYYQWYNNTDLGLTKTNCIIKKDNYCLQWSKNGYDPSNPPYDWDSQSPQGCDSVGVSQPQSAKNCLGIGS